MPLIDRSIRILLFVGSAASALTGCDDDPVEPTAGDDATALDPCATNNGGCGDPAFYSCTGRAGAAGTCGDIDECATSNGGCGDPVFFGCTNNLGAAATCTDIDECATDNGGCGPAGFFTCTNNTGAAPTCADIDECATSNGGCGNPALFTCSNNVGAAPACTDVDECATDNGGCGDPVFFGCTNNLGAAATCTDIDECAADNGGCGDPALSACTNNPGAPPTCTLTDAGVAAAACARFDTCGPPDPSCRSSVEDQLRGPRAHPDDPLCVAMRTAIDAFYRCQLDPAVDACAPDACASDLAALNLLVDTGAGPCLQGQPSILESPGWTCPRGYFGSGDGCDCGCGALDADCAIAVECTTPGCAQFASADDTAACTSCFVDEAAAAAGDSISCTPTIQQIREVFSDADGCTDPDFPVQVRWSISGSTPREIVSARITVPGVYSPFENPFSVPTPGNFETNHDLCFPADYATSIAGNAISFSLRDIDGNLSNEVQADRLPPLSCGATDALFRLRPSDLADGLQIPDNDPAGVASTISLSGTDLTANKVVVFVNDVRHAFNSDLTLVLQAGGLGRTLARRVGGAGNDFRRTVFDDACATPIASGTPPFSGCFAPQQALGAFAGRSLDVDWSLRIIDESAGDAGVLNDWMLGLCL